MEEGNMGDTRVAILAIVVEDKSKAAELNSLLTEFGEYIIGRMGVPYDKKNISLISVALDAPQDVINSLSGKVGSIEGISAKAVYSKV
ncbi:MAG: iron-only hydrogenase system regulator [Lachnospiraceae bacterium]|nr:iron-only hydrogenase system regulator [Lachnospiraceae bacterium]